jgi:hypothetical protein
MTSPVDPEETGGVDGVEPIRAPPRSVMLVRQAACACQMGARLSFGWGVRVRWSLVIVAGERSIEILGVGATRVVTHACKLCVVCDVCGVCGVRDVCDVCDVCDVRCVRCVRCAMCAVQACLRLGEQLHVVEVRDFLARPAGVVDPAVAADQDGGHVCHHRLHDEASHWLVGGLCHPAVVLAEDG